MKTVSEYAPRRYTRPSTTTKKLKAYFAHQTKIATSYTTTDESDTESDKPNKEDEGYIFTSLVFDNIDAHPDTVHRPQNQTHWTPETDTMRNLVPMGSKRMAHVAGIAMAYGHTFNYAVKEVGLSNCHLNMVSTGPLSLGPVQPAATPCGFFSGYTCP